MKELGEDVRAVEEIARARLEIKAEIEKKIIGQHAVVDQLLTALFARGHCLFVGVPGLAKTLLISTLAEVLNLSFNRIQFTPDLMPSDITGTDILEEDTTTGKRHFRFIRHSLGALFQSNTCCKMSSCRSRSDSAWKFSRMRWRRMGVNSARISS